MTKTYDKAVQLLTSKEKFHISLGLERISKILSEFDNPQDKLKVIHVAGTNGKGSFCSILSSVLKASGLKTGLFTSPHISCYNERIKINDKQISDTKFLSILTEINSKAAEKDIYLTEFEILTATAFVYFERQKVDFAVMEVGLGGRLDATNVVKKPFLTVITSLSLDHTERLGKTIELIAKEKAGIIKPGTECIVSANNAGLEVIKKIATEKKAPLILARNAVDIIFENGVNYAIIEDEKYEFSLCGKYQSENLSLVLASIWILRQKGLFITDKEFSKGLKSVKHAARFEYFPKYELIIDGAHNPDGARVLREALNEKFPGKPITFIYATINTKDYTQILKNLLNKGDELVLYDFKRKNAVRLETLKEYSQKVKISDVSEIINSAAQNMKQGRATIITGSLYAIGEIYSDLATELKI